MKISVIGTGRMGDLLPWAKENKDKLTGKILIDFMNHFTEDFSDFTLDWGQSAAEELQRIIPATKVVGAFKMEEI